jgi:hypothetical protein
VGLRRIALVAVLALTFTSAVIGGPAVSAAPKHRAAVVVQHGDTVVNVKCVRFKESKLSGLTLLKRSRLQYIAARYAAGHTICWLDGEGCRSSKPGTGAGTCFCDPVRFWGYWTQESDEVAPLLSGSGPDQRVVRDGAVDYWVWGVGQPPLPPMSIDTACG